MGQAAGRSGQAAEGACDPWRRPFHRERTSRRLQPRQAVGL